MAVKLEKLIDGWKVNGNTISDIQGNDYSVQKVETNKDYAKVVFNGEEGFIFENTPYIWKEPLKDGVIKSFNGKSAVYYEGNVSNVHDWIGELRIEDGYVYGKIRDLKERLILGSDKGFVESGKSGCIHDFRFKNGILYGIFEGMFGYKFVIGSDKGFVESDEYNGISDLEVEGRSVYANVEEDGKEKIVRLDEESNKTKSKEYDRILYWEVEDGKVYADVKKDGKLQSVVLDENLNEMKFGRIRMALRDLLR